MAMPEPAEPLQQCSPMVLEALPDWRCGGGLHVSRAVPAAFSMDEVLNASPCLWGATWLLLTCECSAWQPGAAHHSSDGFSQAAVQHRTNTWNTGARGLVLHRPASLQAPKIQARPKGFYSGPSSGIRNMSRGISRVTAGCSAWKGLVAKGGNVRNAMDYFRSATSVLQRTAC